MATDTTPLAARMRPRTLDEIIGQPHLLDATAPFRASVERGRIPSVLLWGPPGSGKTTLALLVAERAGLRFLRMSAVMDGIKELRDLLQRARDHRALSGVGSVLFVDEIHRWNKAQQDALLPHVEEGLVVLVGATTENPGFEVIPALRSRSWLLQLRPIGPEDLVGLLTRALEDSERGLGEQRLQVEPAALRAIAEGASGDARRALSTLERLTSGLAPGASLSLADVAEALGRRDLLHDATGDAHFDVVSAFIKSMRGSSPDAALYWLARLLEGGEDPMYVARRMVVFAAEDVGNADPRGLTLAVAASEAAHLLGMPEARIPLAQAAVFLATAPKSNASYKAIDLAIERVWATGAVPVPLHLRNAPTKLAKGLGHGEGYLYPHDSADGVVAQEYLPPELRAEVYYRPTDRGQEKVIGERLAWWKRLVFRDEASVPRGDG